MNAEHLLTLYGRVSEAPNVIARLRRFVLDLAVRGKLVAQDVGDEPASELLKRIAAEKARLVKAGKIRRDNSASLTPPDQHMFPVPNSWVWVPATFPAHGVSDLGKKIKTKDVLEAGAFPVVDQGKVLVRGYCDDPEKAIKVTNPMIVFGDHTRETKLIDFDFVVGADGVKLLQPLCIEASYYFLALQWLPLDSRGYGRHFKLLKASTLPLPPLAEQRRIVAKVAELMALLDRLEAARTAREATRDRVTTASLARLTAPDTDPAEFPDNARFALATLPALTTRPDQIKPLRQTILNLAVRGKLVEQDPSDETASELLKRIAVEKAQLEKEGSVRKQKPAAEVTQKERSFSTPPNWDWARLVAIGQTQTGNSPSSSKPELFGSHIPFIKPADLDGSSISYDGPGLSPTGMDYSRVAPANSVLMVCIGATLGKVNVTDRQACFNQQINSVTPFLDGMHGFLSLALKSPVFQELAWSRAGTGTLPIISKGKWEVLPIPLPPLAEQHRIVAKVDALMALCDRLEAALTTADTTRARLLEALLHEALDPAAATA